MNLSHAITTRQMTASQAIGKAEQRPEKKEEEKKKKNDEEKIHNRGYQGPGAGEPVSEIQWLDLYRDRGMIYVPQDDRLKGIVDSTYERLTHQSFPQEREEAPTA